MQSVSGSISNFNHALTLVCIVVYCAAVLCAEEGRLTPQTEYSDGEYAVVTSSNPIMITVQEDGDEEENMEMMTSR